MSATSTPARPRVICLGAGGHAAVVLDAIDAAKACDVVGLVDADPARHGEVVLGHVVVGGDDRLADLARDGATSFIVAFDGVGACAARADASSRARAAGLEALTVIHPAAAVSASALLGPGTVVLAGAVVNARARVEEGAILNTGCIIEHDACIGAHAHVAPGAIVLGGVTVGEGAHVGAGAVVREGLDIGAHAVVGAGAVVVRAVGAGQTVMGVPAAARGEP